MKNLKLSKKLFISYISILVLLIACIAVSVGFLQNIQTQVKTFYNGPFTVKGSANVVNAKFEEMQKSVYRAISNDSKEITQEAIDEANAAGEAIQSEMPTIKKNFLGDQQIVTDIENYLTELKPLREQVLDMASENRNAEAAAFMEENNIPIIKKAQERLNELISTSNTKGETLIAQLQKMQTTAMVVLIVMAVASILISVIFAMYITKSITKPVSEIEKAAVGLSQGKLDSNITYQSRDELGNLADSMRSSMDTLSKMIKDLSSLTQDIAAGNFDVRTNAEDAYVGEFNPILMSLRHMTRSLSTTMNQIRQSADQVASGSEQVSSGAQALSQGSTEQASSVEELAATINEISAQVKNNADNALEATHTAQSVGDDMAESNRKMQDMIKAMGDISDSSNEIGKIMKTIEDIAFQTNILALNAAVEAARAGEAGKGFAVVADEVRNLAIKSQEASKNTATLIETSLKAVENGTEIANETAKTLSSSVEGAQTVIDNISKISQESNAQANSINQVTQGIDQISSVVQTNSATAEESAASSEELSGQSQILKDLVSQFKLRTDITEAAQAESRSSFSSSKASTPQTAAPIMDASKY